MHNVCSWTLFFSRREKRRHATCHHGSGTAGSMMGDVLAYTGWNLCGHKLVWWGQAQNRDNQTRSRACVEILCCAVQNKRRDDTSQVTLNAKHRSETMENENKIKELQIKYELWNCVRSSDFSVRCRWSKFASRSSWGIQHGVSRIVSVKLSVEPREMVKNQGYTNKSARLGTRSGPKHAGLGQSGWIGPARPRRLAEMSHKPVMNISVVEALMRLDTERWGDCHVRQSGKWSLERAFGNHDSVFGSWRSARKELFHVMTAVSKREPRVRLRNTAKPAGWGKYVIGTFHKLSTFMVIFACVNFQVFFTKNHGSRCACKDSILQRLFTISIV